MKGFKEAEPTLDITMSLSPLNHTCHCEILVAHLQHLLGDRLRKMSVKSMYPIPLVGVEILQLRMESLLENRTEICLTGEIAVN